MYYAIEKLAMQYYQPTKSDEIFYTEEQHKAILKQIHNLQIIRLQLKPMVQKNYY